MSGALESLKEAKRIVVKVGTSTLTHDTGSMNLRRVETLARVVADLRNSGREIRLGIKRRDRRWHRQAGAAGCRRGGQRKSRRIPPSGRAS